MIIFACLLKTRNKTNKDNQIMKTKRTFHSFHARAFMTLFVALLTSLGAWSQILFDENGAYFGPSEGEEDDGSGAYYTGFYTSPFKTYLGKSDEEIQQKLDDLWNHYFKGNINSKIYYDRGDEAYILDVNDNDVKSVGMSWGMMIAVQTNHKEEFGKLWNWARNHMWHKNGEWEGYFSWKLRIDGQVMDETCCPDAEMYFMTSLLFAANRWNDSQYMEDAQYIMRQMWENNEHMLFSPHFYVITFRPVGSYNNFSNPSYDLPVYVDLFSRWSDTNKDKWNKATSATRDHLYKSSNTKSGLFSEYNNFDGTPQSETFNQYSTMYWNDAIRCAMNYGMDYYLFGVDADRQTEMAKRIIDFFENDGYQHAQFNWDGTNASGQYSLGQKGANAVACYALMNLPEYEEAIKKNLNMAWDATPMTGQYRYYDGLVHYMAMLHLCGAFKIWKPQSATLTAQTEVDGILYNLNANDHTAKAFYVQESSGNVVIPQTIDYEGNKYSVTSIGKHIFEGCSNLASVTINDPKVKIGENAFDGLTCVFDLPDDFEYGGYGSMEEFISKTGIASFQLAEKTSVTISNAGVATFYCFRGLDLGQVAGLEAYIANDYNKTTSYLSMQQVTETPAYTGLLLVGTPGTYEIPYKTSEDITPVGENLLAGTIEAVTIPSTDDVKTNFVLYATKDTMPTFRPLANGFNLKANRAYLQIPTADLPDTSASSNVSIGFGEMTGIDSLPATISPSGTWHTIDGRQFNGTPTQKGLYIIDGGKVVVK